MWHETRRGAQRPRCATRQRLTFQEAKCGAAQRSPEALISDVLNGTHRSGCDKSGEFSMLNLNAEGAFQVGVNAAHLALLINTYLTAA